MRFLVIALFILFTSFVSTSQEQHFEFQTVDMRTPTGWDIRNISGEVVFYEGKDSHTISIVTENKSYKLYVKSKQLFIREFNYLYTLIDDYGQESSVRLILENRSDKYIQFYFYSNRPREKYFRLCLKKCE